MCSGVPKSVVSVSVDDDGAVHGHVLMKDDVLYFEVREVEN